MGRGLGEVRCPLHERLLVVPATLLALQVQGAPSEVVVSTQNIRLALSPAEARHDIRHAATGSSILLMQEMGHRRARRLAPPGWGTAHYVGQHRRGDCATFWDRSRWTRVRTELVPLNWTDSRRALVVVLRSRKGAPTTVATVCVHMITGPLHRPGLYRRATTRLHRVGARLARHHPVIIGGDWNLDHPWDVTHRWEGFPYARFAGWGSRAPALPTVGRQHADYFYWNQPAWLFRGISPVLPTFSDHAGVRIVLDPAA
jgi:hypothetical protein